PNVPDRSHRRPHPHRHPRKNPSLATLPPRRRNRPHLFRPRQWPRHGLPQVPAPRNRPAPHPRRLRAHFHPQRLAARSLRHPARRLTPPELVTALLRRIPASVHPHLWILLFDEREVLARAAELEALSPAAAAKLPLFGLPFAVKDNIDVAGKPTTAACPDFA